MSAITRRDPIVSLTLYAVCLGDCMPAFSVVLRPQDGPCTTCGGAIILVASLGEAEAAAGMRAERDALRAERDALRAEVEQWREDARRVAAEECAPDERHCTCVVHLRRELDRARADATAREGLMRRRVDSLRAAERERDRLASWPEDGPRESGDGVIVKDAPTGASMIAAERARQVSAEGYSLEHDDAHHNGEMVAAAIAYAERGGDHGKPAPYGWPWADEWWKPTTRLRGLVKAGALIAAEIDRLLRAGEKP